MFPHDAIFYLEFSDTVGSTSESVSWYTAARLWELHFAVSRFVEAQLDEAYAGHSGWLNTAEYPDFQELLDVAEMEVFRSAAGAERKVNSWKSEYDNEFDGLCAVIRYRLKDKTVPGMQSAIELFDWVLEFGLFQCQKSDDPPVSVVMVGDVHEFAPFLLDRITDNTPAEAMVSARRPDAFDVTFRPLIPVIEELRKEVERPNWLENGVALTLFTYIYDLYEAAIKKEYG